MSDGFTPHGRILEAARGSMSKRAAAGRAGISEGRWRQIVTGVQKVGGGRTIPVNPKRDTLVAMAHAVQADVPQVLTAAGMSVGAAGEDAGYVAAPGQRVEGSVTNDEIMARLDQIARDLEQLKRRGT